MTTEAHTTVAGTKVHNASLDSVQSGPARLERGRSVRNTKVFNQSDRFVEGWHWLLPSRELQRSQVKAVRLLGRELVVYRSDAGQVYAADAYCPHMGAHLAEGRV